MPAQKNEYTSALCEFQGAPRTAGGGRGRRRRWACSCAPFFFIRFSGSGVNASSLISCRAHGVPLEEGEEAEAQGACRCFPSLNDALVHCERAYLQVGSIGLTVPCSKQWSKCIICNSPKVALQATHC